MFCFIFFNDTATTEIYTLSLHDALPICLPADQHRPGGRVAAAGVLQRGAHLAGVQRVDPGVGVEDGEQHRRVLGSRQDRKSTRLNSSHANISYAVFCLKKKKKRSSTE